MCSINILEQTIECVTHVDIQYNVLVLAISGCIHKDPPLNSNNIIHGAIKDKVLIKFCNYLHCWTITFQEMEDILMGFRISIQYPSGSLMKASPFIFPSFGFFTNSTPKDRFKSFTSFIYVRNHNANMTKSSRVTVSIVIRLFRVILCSPIMC